MMNVKRFVRTAVELCVEADADGFCAPDRRFGRARDFLPGVRPSHLESRRLCSDTRIKIDESLDFRRLPDDHSADLELVDDVNVAGRDAQLRDRVSAFHVADDSLMFAAVEFDLVSVVNDAHLVLDSADGHLNRSRRHWKGKSHLLTTTHPFPMN